jgi:hypothetical protein
MIGVHRLPQQMETLLGAVHCWGVSVSLGTWWVGNLTKQWTWPVPNNVPDWVGPLKSPSRHAVKLPNVS